MAYFRMAVSFIQYVELLIFFILMVLNLDGLSSNAVSPYAIVIVG